MTEPTSSLLQWPNVVRADDFESWSGDRTRNVPSTFDPRYHAPLLISEAGTEPTAAALFTAKDAGQPDHRRHAVPGRRP